LASATCLETQHLLRSSINSGAPRETRDEHSSSHNNIVNGSISTSVCTKKRTWKRMESSAVSCMRPQWCSVSSPQATEKSGPTHRPIGWKRFKPKVKDDDQSSTDDDILQTKTVKAEKKKSIFRHRIINRNNQEPPSSNKGESLLYTAESDSNWVQDSGGVEFFDNVLTTHTVIQRKLH